MGYSVLLLGGLCTFAFMVYSADGFSLSTTGFTVWALAPYAVFALATYVARTRGSIMAASLGSVLAVSVGIFVYIDVFFVHVSSTSALAFLSIPFCQLLGAIVALVFAFERRRHATQDI